jgi:hypothetical protein
MDNRHKSALRRVRTDFCDDLALGTKFYAELIKEKIFIEHQIEQIKVFSFFMFCKENFQIWQQSSLVKLF